MRSIRRTAAALSSLVVLGSGLGGCGGQPAVCEDVDALQESVDTLKNTDAGEDGLSKVKTELKEMQTELQQLADDASSQYSTQIDKLNADFSGLKSSVTAAVDAPSAETLSAVKVDVQSVGSAIDDLGTAVADTC